MCCFFLERLKAVTLKCVVYYRGKLDSDGKLSIKSNMNNWHLISYNVCTKINVLLDLINIREGNISCDGFTGEEINFMIYDLCVN